MGRGFGPGSNPHAGTPDGWGVARISGAPGVVEIVSVVTTPHGASYAYPQQRIVSNLFLVEGLL